MIRFHVTAIIKEGYQDAGNRGGVWVEAKNEKDAFKKARLHPVAYDLDTLQCAQV
ncbi:hypothetical protein [Paenibacillus elgii]|uniref:hypothetical protein n=1 Tax=Paenibacillus elgii TaxID=189691 RepID=UPI00203B5B62|nr:hypothetical protein [Paenibacillus elgii]MCM3273060.1 hypothetical protein [Paenibacillus elgii]